jgi:hypothetical protein
MLLWAKKKLQLMNDSLVQLPLRRTRRHWTDHLLLHFHATSVMMSCAPPVVAPSLVLSQNLKTLAWLASRWNNPLDVDAWPHTVFIRSSVLIHKPTNLLHLVLIHKPTNLLHLVLRPKPKNHHGDFEAQITKPSTLVLRPKPRNSHSSFEAEPLTNCHHRFCG